MIKFRIFSHFSQLLVDGYPDRVCDYCHLQLNTFHAFVNKAKSSSKQFESILCRTKSEKKSNQITKIHIINTEFSGDERSVVVDEVEYIVDDGSYSNIWRSLFMQSREFAY